MSTSTKRAAVVGTALASSLVFGSLAPVSNAGAEEALANALLPLPTSVITPGLCKTTAGPTSITENIQGYAGGHLGTPSMTDEIITYIQNCTFSAPPLTIATQETCTPQYNGLNLWLSYYLGYIPSFVQTKFIGGYCNSFGNANFVRDGYNGHDVYAKTYQASHQEPGATELRALVCNRAGNFVNSSYYAKYAGCSSHMAPNQTSAAGLQVGDYGATSISLSSNGYRAYSSGDFNFLPAQVGFISAAYGSPFYSNFTEVDGTTTGGNQNTISAGKYDYTFVDNPASIRRDADVYSTSSDHKMLVGFTGLA